MKKLYHCTFDKCTYYSDRSFNINMHMKRHGPTCPPYRVEILQSIQKEGGARQHNLRGSGSASLVSLSSDSVSVTFDYGEGGGGNDESDVTAVEDVMIEEKPFSPDGGIMRVYKRAHPGGRTYSHFFCTMQGCSYKSNRSFNFRSHIRNHVAKKRKTGC